MPDLGDGRHRALGLVEHGHLPVVAEGAVDLGAGDEVLAGDLGRRGGRAGGGPVGRRRRRRPTGTPPPRRRWPAARRPRPAPPPSGPGRGPAAGPVPATAAAVPGGGSGSHRAWPSKRGRRVLVDRRSPPAHDRTAPRRDRADLARPALSPPGPNIPPHAFWASWNVCEPGSMPPSAPPPMLDAEPTAAAREVGVGHVDAVLPHALGELEGPVLGLGVHRRAAVLDEVVEDVAAGLVGRLELLRQALARRPGPPVAVPATAPRRASRRADHDEAAAARDRVWGSGMSTPCSRMHLANSSPAFSAVGLLGWPRPWPSAFTPSGPVGRRHLGVGRRRAPAAGRRPGPRRGPGPWRAAPAGAGPSGVVSRRILLAGRTVAAQGRGQWTKSALSTP